MMTWTNDTTWHIKSLSWLQEYITYLKKMCLNHMASAEADQFLRLQQNDS